MTSSPVTTRLFNRRTVVRSLALIPAVYAADALIPVFAGADTPVTVTKLPNGGRIELIAAASKTMASNAGGYVKPDATNTGVKPGTALTPYRGDIVVTTPGTVIENQDIYGFIKIRAANVIVRNCRVRGSGPGSSNTGLIDCNHSAVRNALIEDCLLVPDFPSVWLDGVIGKEYTARRVNVYNTVDGFGVYNASDRSAPTNVTIQSCYIHDLAYFAVDPNHDNGPTHNDAVQIQGGANITIVGNNIQGFLSKTAGDQNYSDIRWNQGILAQPNLAPITNSDISFNWFDGCKVHVYFTVAAGKTQLFGRCTGNRSGTNQYKYGGSSTYQLRLKRGVTFTNSLSENVWDASGVAFKESTTGGIRYE